MRQAITTAAKLFSFNRWDPRAHLSIEDRCTERSDGKRFRISDVARERREQSKPPTDPTARFVYIGLENVEPGTGDIVGDVAHRGGDIRSPSKHFRKGDVLLSRLRPSLNKVCCPIFAEGYCSGEFVVLEPNVNIISARVLRELLALANTVKRLISLVAGATLPRVSASEIFEIDIPRIESEKMKELTRTLEKEDAKRHDWKTQLREQPSRLEQLIRNHCS